LVSDSTESDSIRFINIEHMFLYDLGNQRQEPNRRLELRRANANDCELGRVTDFSGPLTDTLIVRASSGVPINATSAVRPLSETATSASMVDPSSKWLCLSRRSIV
jgi:hypothetical protein